MGVWVMFAKLVLLMFNRARLWPASMDMLCWGGWGDLYLPVSAGWGGTTSHIACAHALRTSA